MKGKIGWYEIKLYYKIINSNDEGFFIGWVLLLDILKNLDLISFNLVFVCIVYFRWNISFF